MPSYSRLSPFTRWPLIALAAACLAVAAAPLPAQSDTAKIAVIDVGRILEESNAGMAALAELKTIKDQKEAEAVVFQEELKALQARITEGRLSLSQDRLEGLTKEMQSKVIALQRFEDDSNRELQEVRQEKLGAIERKIMPVITTVGEEFGYTLMFNKFQSGLVFAKLEVDITDLILERFDAATAAESGE